MSAYELDRTVWGRMYLSNATLGHIILKLHIEWNF
jgi:hypothetical protein